MRTRDFLFITASFALLGQFAFSAEPLLSKKKRRLSRSQEGGGGSGTNEYEYDEYENYDEKNGKK